MRFMLEVVITVALVAMILLTLLFLAGCAASQTTNGLSDTRVNDYQLGDFTSGAWRTLESYQLEYCATADPGRRAFLLAIIRVYHPSYPESGLCTDAGKVIVDRIAEDMPIFVPNPDVERAIEDQQRAQERLAQPDADAPAEE